SFLGCNPYESIIGKNNETIVTQLQTDETTTYNSDIFTYFNKHFQQLNLDIPLPFYGGAVGYIGYDAVNKFLPEQDDTIHSYLMVYRDMIVFDHSLDKIYLLTI